MDKCIPCKKNTYNDLFGQAGCNKCGPSAFSAPNRYSNWATTCTCVGRFRRFVKSSGSCLCGRGYQPKNKAPNKDSLADCEAEVQRICSPSEDVDLNGKCISKQEQGDICKKQCYPGNGKMVEGTGLCECDKIQDLSKVCGSKCQQTTTRTYMDKDGQFHAHDPTKGKKRGKGQVDPSSIPGYYGNFKCNPAPGLEKCNTVSMQMTAEGSFAFDYGADEELTKAAGVSLNVARDDTSLLTKFHRFMHDPRANWVKWRRRKQAGRRLQTESALEQN